MIPAPLTGGGTQRRVGASSRVPTEMKTRLPRVGPQGQMTGGQHCREGGQGLPGRPKVPLAQACKEEDFDLSGGDPHAPAMNKSDVQLWRMIFFNVYKFSGF